MPASWNVEYVHQTHGMSCWAACFAMLVNFRDGTQYTDMDICEQTGIGPDAGANDHEYPALMAKFNLQSVAGSCMTPEGWEELIGSKPTIVGITGHVVVVSGTNGESDLEKFEAYVLDPGEGPTWWPYSKLEQQFELRARREIHMIQTY
jgi:ABC-type bacteriocin/lantibiotic exporter with double-glycine peptidase domain